MGITEYEVRQYLQSIKFLTGKRDKKLEQIEELRSVATNCVAKLDKDPVQTSGSGDKMPNIVGRMVDLQKEADELDKIIHERTALVIRMSDNLEDKRCQKYLFTRYIDLNSFYDTVMIMELSDSTARRIEKKAISELTKLLNAQKHENHKI